MKMAASTLPRIAFRSLRLRPCAPCAPCPARPSSARSASTSSSTPSGDTSTATTHFGYTTVPASAKAGLVGDVFHRVADSYDVMNDLMSGTLHRAWKDCFVSSLGPIVGRTGPTTVLDVAGGTGDIAFRLAASMAGSWEAPPTPPTLIVSDINPSMLGVGKARWEAAPPLPGTPVHVEWLVANAESLPLPDASVDLYTIAFGIRNVTRVDVALAEAARVLKKGGRFACLEFSTVANPLLASAYDAYSFAVIPALGQAVAGDRASYQYLVESIRKFPGPAEFAAMIEAAGLVDVRAESWTGGVVAMHSGMKI